MAERTWVAGWDGYGYGYGRGNEKRKGAKEERREKKETQVENYNRAPWKKKFFFGKACGEGSTYILYITTYLEMGAIGGSLAYWDIICYCRLFINLVHSCITAHRKEQETIA